MTMAIAHFESQWRRTAIAEDDLARVAEFTGLSPEECLRRLAEYRTGEMAAAWRRAAAKNTVTKLLVSSSWQTRRVDRHGGRSLTRLPTMRS
jgi:hypothetical protein